MNTVVALLLRNMRAPLVVLVVSYAVSVLGMVLMPGPVIDGQERPLDFFYAFYVVSYTATTIGFGEIPYAFSDAQRAWLIVTIYLTVITWVYAIGKILALVQAPTFRQAVKEQAFARAVRRLREPFYIVCGYGDTGSLLVHSMIERGYLPVVIDHDPARVSSVELGDHPVHVPALCADASLADPLIEAGLLHPMCRGVVAVTAPEATNLKIALTVKLLAPHLMLSCRADSPDTEANLAALGIDQIINPFDLFGDRLALAIHSPVQHLLQEWLTAVPNTPLHEPLQPARGTWILCGYGRFGKEVAEDLQREGIHLSIIDRDPELNGCPGHCVKGRGTEEATLRAAGIEQAVGIVAGTDDDANNLSIVMAARRIKPELFTVVRQNLRHHDAIIRAARADLVMQRSEVITRRILILLGTPLLTEFLALARGQSTAWANQLASRVSAVSGDTVPEVWSVTVDAHDAPAVLRVLLDQERITLGTLLIDPRDREHALPVVPLLLARAGVADVITPDPDTELMPGDRLLLCGPLRARGLTEWIVRNHNVLAYTRTGRERPAGWLFAWLERRRA